MTTANAFNTDEVCKFHRFLALVLQAEQEQKELPPHLFRSMGLTKAQLEEKFQAEDARGIAGLNSLVRELGGYLVKGRTLNPEEYELQGKPLLVYNFEEKGRQAPVVSIYAGLKPDKSREKKYAEWLLWGRDMEHARAMMVVKSTKAPARPPGVERVVFQMMSDSERENYRRKHYAKWKDYSKKWGFANRSVLVNVVQDMESRFSIIDHHPSHMLFKGIPLTAKSYRHTFVPHTDLEGRVAEIQQNNYRFRNPEEAEKFINHVMGLNDTQLTPNEEYVSSYLRKGILRYDEMFLFEKKGNQILVVRDADIVTKIIAPMLGPEYEAQMYYLPRIAMLKKSDHTIMFSSEAESRRHWSRRIATRGAAVSNVDWLPKGLEGAVISIDSNSYLVIREGRRIIETKFDDIKKERDRVLDKFGFYRKRQPEKRDARMHYLDEIGPVPLNLSYGWFVSDATNPDIFAELHDMKQEKSRGIRSANYIELPKRLPQYGKNYKYGASVNMDLLWAGVKGQRENKYELMVMTPELEVEYWIGEFARANYSKIRDDARLEQLKNYKQRFDRLMDELC